MVKPANFNVLIASADVTTDERTYQLTAPESVLKSVIERLSLISLSSLSADISIVYDRTFKAIKVSGRVRAELEQPCVVTLEPVPETVDDSFDLLLVSPEQAEQYDNDELYLDPTYPDYDSLDTDHIDLGEVAIQTLSILMAEYPRKEGVELQEDIANGLEVNKDLAGKPNPFAALSKLRDES